MTGDTTMSFALLIALVTIACTVYNTLTGKKSQSQKDVDQQIKEALMDASIRSAHKRMDSAGIGRADLIEHIEHEKVERNEHHGE